MPYKYIKGYDVAFVSINFTHTSTTWRRCHFFFPYEELLVKENVRRKKRLKAVKNMRAGKTGGWVVVGGSWRCEVQG